MAAVPANDYVTAKDNQDLDHLPGKYGKPFIGYTFPFLMRPYDVLDGIYKTYGPISKASLTFQRMVICLGPEYIKLLTLDRDQVFSPKMGYDGPLGDFFDGGLLMRDFGEHKIHRRIMQSAFKTEAMRGYVDEMHPIIDNHLQRWSNDQNFHFYPNIKTLLLDLGSKVFLGLDMDGEETKALNQDFLDMMAGTLSLIRKDWPGLLYRKGMNGRRGLEKFFTELVPGRRSNDGKDMASYFSKETDEDGNLFSEKVVADHLIFLLLAAHDTTTSALTMTAYLLAHDQEWQEKIRQEALTLNSGQLSYDDLGSSVPNMQNVFHETLRLYPPVPQFMRRTVKDIEIDGHHIPAHSMLQCSPLYTHRMEEYWTNPHGFDPDRFAAGREEHKQHPFLWAPFGGGAHKCIGMHFADMIYKSVLSKMVTNYRWSFAKEEQYPSKIQYFPFSKPIDDLPLKMELIK
ncbi:cytochrome P450 [Oceanicoccus sp. KOV_DT_Chl]|uniref:cytochrome P450 n=1 Tax=Oceanicoccus sp. KOV_DT_Chl TaxID=1904639 RepID=UPI00135BD750|nr:cytochrome P450 [Oceanicoccus sp. KOV_DT_Chl]